MVHWSRGAAVGRLEILVSRLSLSATRTLTCPFSPFIQSVTGIKNAQDRSSGSLVLS